MAPTPDDAAHLTAPIRRLYEDAERGLVGRIARAVGRGKGALGGALARMFGLSKAARKIIDGLNAKVTKQLPPLIVEAYEIGAGQAAVEVDRLRRAERESNQRGRESNNRPRNGSEGLPGPADPQQLARRLTTEAHPLILRTTDDVYRRIVAEVYAPALAEGRPRLEASQRALDRFAREGITGFVDRTGRRWSLPAYAEMAMRTAFARAAVAGALDRYRADGIDLVGVPDIPMGCPLCEPWEGKILALREGVTPPRGIRVAGTVAEATARGLFHPNCRHSIVPITGPASVAALGAPRPDPAGYAATQQQRALERRIRTAKLRLVVAQESGADAATLRTRRKAVADRQAEIRVFLRAHPELLRYTSREQVRKPGASTDRAV